jgi:hypothetical protein
MIGDLTTGKTDTEFDANDMVKAVAEEKATQALENFKVFH